MHLAGFDYRFEAARTSTPARTFLLLHGTGGDEHDLIPLGRMLDPDAALLSPRGQVLEHGAPRFFRRLAEGVFDLDDLHDRTTRLAEFIMRAAETHDLDPATILAIGFSNGANIAASLLLSHPGVLAGGILIRAMVPFEPAAAPSSGSAAAHRMQSAMQHRSAVLLSEGGHDPLVHTRQAERLSALLQEAGADVTLVWQNAGHQLVQGDVDAARRWLTELHARR